MMRKSIGLLLLGLLYLLSFCGGNESQSSYAEMTASFNDNWEFVKDIEEGVDSAMFMRKSELNWEKVSLPHTAQIEPLVIKGDQWQGICQYRKFFTLSKEYKNKDIALKFEGAMQLAKIYLNGKLLRTNYSGYLPFYVDLTEHVKIEEENCLVVTLDNTDNQSIPPGKPIQVLDFNIYSGIYRNVWLVVNDKLHISDPINADKVAGGGVFVTYDEVSEQSARVNISVDVINNDNKARNTKVEAIIKDIKGDTISVERTEEKLISEVNSNSFKLVCKLSSPKLWSPDNPNLYDLIVNVLEDGKTVDSEKLKIGVRKFSINADKGFVLNGKEIKLRGTNRHQEYPYIGYAISDNANYRDAYKIKQAGFNFVRLSHYPQSNSFLKACDELGILVMDAIPGWQFFGDSVFQDNAITDVRKMVRRDRNHPSIILWEASLNETEMSKDFMQRAHAAVHEEFPVDNVYSSGWIDGIYDVFIPARQHAKPPYYWNKYSSNKPVLIAEYGDWEYYAHNAGFNQKEYKNLSEEERNSRQLRGFGQKRLLQQALNYQESYNDNLNGNMIGDANWLMFDYNRGYAPDIEASGIMDIFRIPKFAFYFYQSQVTPVAGQEPDFDKPMVAIANYYNDPSLVTIKVYSNCEEVELQVNGRTIEKRKPDNGKNSTNLKHPPFTFNLKAFEPGELKATGYINERAVASDVKLTPESPSGIKLWIDESGKKLEKGCKDLVFLYAAVTDKNGTIIPTAINQIEFRASGDAKLIGSTLINAEAGIAGILLQAGNEGGEIKVSALSEGLQSAEINLKAL